MTKLIVPQIGDIVRGQVVTEAAHKLWVDLVNKVDALESVASDDLTDDLTLLTETVEAQARFIPKITTQVTDRFNPVEDGYDWYLVTATCQFTISGSVGTSIQIRLADGSGDIAAYGFTTYAANGATPTIEIGCRVAVTNRMMVSGAWLRFYAVQTTTEIPVTGVKWTAIKYKTEY